MPLYKVATYKRGDTSWLVATRQNEKPSPGSIELVVRVPREVQFFVSGYFRWRCERSGSRCAPSSINWRGSPSDQGIRGVVSVEIGGQDIDVGTVNSDGRFHTAGGTIAVDDIKGDLDAFTGGGTISLGTGLRNAVLESGAGDVRVTFCGGTLRAQSRRRQSGSGGCSRSCRYPHQRRKFA